MVLLTVMITKKMNGHAIMTQPRFISSVFIRLESNGLAPKEHFA